MSVVCWDDHTLAADCQGTNQGLRFRISKIRRLDDGTVLAWTGTQGSGIAMTQWYEAGAKLDGFPASQKTEEWSRLIVALPSGRVLNYETIPVALEALDAPAAWGSGRDFALGAMAMGADAKRAVEIANQFNTDCGFGVEAYDVKALELAAVGD